MKNRRVNRAQRNRLRVEVLESRLAPATLVNPTTVTYKDVDGDLVTVEISQPLFNSGTINNVFLFDSGSVNGNNAIPQQLQKVDLTALGSAASQLSLDVTAQAGANVGFINATGIDLTSVLVAGDLGKIDAGDTTTSTPGSWRWAAAAGGGGWPTSTATPVSSRPTRPSVTAAATRPSRWPRSGPVSAGASSSTTSPRPRRRSASRR